MKLEFKWHNKPLIYVAGPLTSSGSEFKNVHKAIEIGETIWDLGGIGFVPHLSCFWSFAFPQNRTYDHWLEYDLNILQRCDALYRIAGKSYGADIEVKVAKHLGKPVFYSLDDLKNYIEGGCYAVHRIQVPKR